MFGAPQQSPAEIRAAEEASTQNIYSTMATCALLYLSPFVVDYAKSFF